MKVSTNLHPSLNQSAVSPALLSMHKQLTRKDLYSLVWTKPRTELAKQFGISDVAIGKLCRQMNVPAPPAGYWAHVASNGPGKSKYIRPPLTYTVVERIDEDHASIQRSLPTIDPEKLDEPLPPPPSFPEPADDAIERYLEQIKAVTLPKPARGTHPVVAKLEAEDARLAAAATEYSWQKPKYAGPQGRKLLDGLNRLLWWWNDLGFKTSSSGTRHICLYVSVGSSYHQSFEITVAPAPQGVSGKSKPPEPAFELRFDIDYRYTQRKEKPALVFSNFDSEAFAATARLLIKRREMSFRDWIRRSHEHLVWQRDEAIKKDRAAKEAERLRVEEEHRALVAAREQAIDQAIVGINRSDQLRSLVSHVEQQMRGAIAADASFADWKKWMLEKADALDIRTRSPEAIADWIASFRLSDVQAPR